jgi:hypothetical protein
MEKVIVPLGYLLRGHCALVGYGIQPWPTLSDLQGLIKKEGLSMYMGMFRGGHFSDETSNIILGSYLNQNARHWQFLLLNIPPRFSWSLRRTGAGTTSPAVYSCVNNRSQVTHNARNMIHFVFSRNPRCIIKTLENDRLLYVKLGCQVLADEESGFDRERDKGLQNSM